MSQSIASFSEHAVVYHLNDDKYSPMAESIERDMSLGLRDSPLGKLPLEVRLMIMEIIASTTIIPQLFKYEPPKESRKSEWVESPMDHDQSFLNFILTCRLVHAESLLVRRPQRRVILRIPDHWLYWLDVQRNAIMGEDHAMFPFRDLPLKTCHLRIEISIALYHWSDVLLAYMDLFDRGAKLKSFSLLLMNSGSYRPTVFSTELARLSPKWSGFKHPFLVEIQSWRIASTQALDAISQLRGTFISSTGLKSD